ncbi:hypothetical protein GCM10022215_24740 [Nocardioides fonticola]|uniref:Poly(3-hydroxybutyrate) depolymerase n=1 Tax=Nocardioides fonticola TaxID=450363 RepID=A0ABP7XK55_9ACTN
MMIGTRMRRGVGLALATACALGTWGLGAPTSSAAGRAQPDQGTVWVRPALYDRVDPLDPYRGQFDGKLWQKSITATYAGTQQTFGYHLYIPNGFQLSATGIIVLAGDGVDAPTLIEDEHWKAIAEANKTVVAVLAAPDGTWDLSSDDTSDMAFVNAVRSAMSAKNEMYAVHESKIYAVGYGSGGAMAQMAGMLAPINWAGIATFDAADVPASARDRARTTPVSAAFPDLMRARIAMPVWMISHGQAQDAQVDFWKEAANVASSPSVNALGAVAYQSRLRPDENPRNTEAVAQVWLSEGVDETWLDQHADEVFPDFLHGVRRFLGEPGGILKRTVDLTAPGYSVEKKLVDGRMRQWIQYVPTSVRQHPDTPVPVVYVLHGRQCNGEIILEHTDWDEVAEARGFIAVFPTAYPRDYADSRYPTNNWNAITKDQDWLVTGDPAVPTYSDVDFFRSISDSIDQTYAVDASRRYVTGHSNGGGMTITAGVFGSDFFAAIAPTSSIHDTSTKPLADFASTMVDRMPVAFYGGSADAANSIYPNYDDAASYQRKTADFFKAADGTEDAPQVYRSGKFTTRTFFNGRVPMVVSTTIAGMGHAYINEESWRIWDETFSQFSRDADGTSRYQGVAVTDQAPSKATPVVTVAVPRIVRDRRASVVVTVSADDVPASGRVTASIDGRSIAAGRLADGRLTLKLPRHLAVGRHGLVVEYLGNATTMAGVKAVTIRVHRR